jgi:ABC-type uncharacterized transport system ATPase subunit
VPWKKRISFLAETFEIDHLLEIPVRKLSLGQRMRCEVALSLLHNPRLILLDEQSIGLDVVAKQRIRDTIKAMNQIMWTKCSNRSFRLADFWPLSWRPGNYSIHWVTNRTIIR